jgi:hypothetical protein
VRRLLPALAAAVAIGGSAGCTADEPPRPDTPPPAAAFTSEFARTSATLRWSYRLRNTSAAALLAFNGPNPDQPADGPAVWIVPGDDGTVQVAQRLLGPPPGVDVGRPVLVHGTVIPPGEEITGAAEVRLPLAVRHPYQGAFDPAVRLPDDAGQVVFCLGVARQSEFVPMPTDQPPQPTDQPTATQASAPAATPAAPPGPLYAHLAGSERRQHLFCSPPQRIS